MTTLESFKFNNLIEKIKTSNMFINYSRILPYAKPYWFRAILAILVCIPIGSLDAVIALSLKPYMDIVMVEKSVQSPWYIPFAIVAFTIIQGLLNYIATYLNTWVGGKITNDLKMDLYKKMLTYETAYFDKKNSGDILFRFNKDADAACGGLLNNIKTFTSRLFSSLSLICVLFYNSWQLAIIATLVLGGAFLPLANLRKRIDDVMKKSVHAGAAIMTIYNETYSGNKTITSYNLAEYQEKSFKKILGGQFMLKIKMTQRTSWLSPMMHIIVSVGIGLAIGYGSYLIITNKITSGNFVSFITALIMLYTPIKNLGNNFNSVQMSFLAIERVFKLLDKQPKIHDKENALPMDGLNDSITFENVTFKYVKDKPVLKGISFNVKKGETIALVGNSGGGKSTIVSLIPRFYDVKKGAIKIDGIDIRDYKLYDLRKNIAVVFQDNFLFSGTIRENILLGKFDATEEEIEKAIKMAYLDEFISTLKDGLDTEIGERGVLLSGGQKQRVAIARAFLKNAPIVILDEATSALDNKSEAIVQMAIDNLMQDKTVFVIAHRLSTIQNADRIAVINEGLLAELGTHDELMQIENGKYKDLYEMQFKKQIVPV
jgi:subfamily B ATP-binding cassette protein MsbA